MSIRWYEYSKCSTCVKAKSLIKNTDLRIEYIDITTNPPTIEELKMMLDIYQGELRRLFNVSGEMYRLLKIKDTLKSMTIDQALELLSQNGKLIKRPFVVAGENSFVGFNQTTIESLCNNNP